MILVVIDDPSVLASAALRTVDHEGALAEGDPGEASRNDGDFFSVKNVWAEIDVSALDTVFAVAWTAGERDDRLSDVIARVCEDGLAELFDFGFGGMRPYQHSVSAAFIGAFDDEFVEVLEYISTVFGEHGQVGRHILEQRFLLEIEPDHIRDEIVHHLVVGCAGADCVGKVHIALPVCGHQPGDAEDRIWAEGEGIEEVVIESAIDHIDPFEAFCGFHVDDVVFDDQVLADNDLYTHAPGEERVFEVGGVVDARGEEYDGGVLWRWAVNGGDVTEESKQLLAVVVDGPYLLVCEQRGEDPLHHLAIGQNIADSGRAAPVVLEHQVVSVSIADEVTAAYMDVDVFWDIDSDEFRAEMFRALDDLEGDDSLLEDALVVVEVVKKEIEGGDSLDQSAFDPGPLVSGDDTGDGVEGHDPLGAAIVAVDSERDALVEKGL